jgi:hypothetical protein
MRQSPDSGSWPILVTRVHSYSRRLVSGVPAGLNGLCHGHFVTRVHHHHRCANQQRQCHDDGGPHACSLATCFVSIVSRTPYTYNPRWENLSSLACHPLKRDAMMRVDPPCHMRGATVVRSPAYDPSGREVHGGRKEGATWRTDCKAAFWKSVPVKYSAHAGSVKTPMAAPAIQQWRIALIREVWTASRSRGSP